jgi:hypothetical protein
MFLNLALNESLHPVCFICGESIPGTLSPQSLTECYAEDRIFYPLEYFTPVGS